MQVHFTKVVHFTRLIKAGGRLREFNFRKHKQQEDDVFSVDTGDDRGNRILFLYDKSGQWQLVYRKKSAIANLDHRKRG